jgi:hypothetical protein
MAMDMRISLNIVRYGPLCLLFAALSWGQGGNSVAAPAKPAPATPDAAQAAQSQRGEGVDLAFDVPVITISGLCGNPPAENAAAANCKTVIRRAEFEKVIDAVQPNMPARARREFAMRYADALVMAKRAEQMGLDKGPNFEEQMEVARIQILSQEVTRVIQKESSQISDQDVIDYYRDNASSFEQVEMDRIYIPKTQGQPGHPAKVASDSDAQNQSQQTEQSMKVLADQLHTRAVAGEDFNELQVDAYKIAGINVASGASTTMGKIRRISLPRSQLWVMDLKPGEVSSVIADTNGYFIYKVKNKETLSLDQAREEIKGVLRSRRIQNETQAIQKSASSTLNEVYFSPQHRAQGPTEAAK